MILYLYSYLTTSHVRYGNESKQTCSLLNGKIQLYNVQLKTSQPINIYPCIITYAG